MRISISTIVNGQHREIMDRFDLDLFEALKPPIGKMMVKEFTGSQKGDIVHLKFISPIKSEWISTIVEDGSDHYESYFIDEGTTLPPPLKSWRHEHKVKQVNTDQSNIVDDITYHTGSWIVDILVYPVLWIMFYYRTFIYKRYFD